MPSLLIRRSGLEVLRHPLVHARTSVGSRKSCDIPLEGPLIQGIQGFIERRGAEFFFAPVASGDAILLEPGRPYALGDFTLEVAYDQGKWGQRMTEALQEPRSGVVPTHLLINIQGAERTMELPASLSFGAGPQADLRIEDPAMSQLHGRFRKTPKGLWIEDLDSTNGIRRSLPGNRGPGQRVERGEVMVNERLYAGRAVLTPMLLNLSHGNFGHMVGTSEVMREHVYSVIGKVAPEDVSVLVIGETGTGKELVARELHDRSLRAGKPFVVVNCGAIAKDVVESELFGHEKGAFTGAVAQHQGYFEQADGGTLFLDELGELPLQLQPKLLRVVQQGTLRRVGGKEDVRVDVRIVSATNADLHLAVADGEFREDLFYRLAEVTIRLPPLRDRGEDLQEIIEKMLEQMSPPGQPTKVSEAAWKKLLAHPWPGNVRELGNVLRAAHIFRDARSDTIEAKHLKLQILVGSSEKLKRGVAKAGPKGWVRFSGRTLDEIIYEVIVNELDAGPNQKAAADRLGITPKTLRERLKRMKKTEE